MIVILKYSNTNEQELSELLGKLKLDYTFTLNESKILKASHIILPDTKDINFAIRKMQMMNLYSALRLVKKPILGIGNGFNMMCNNLTDIKKLGLGFFPIDSNTLNTDEDLDSKNKSVEIKNKEKYIRNGRIKILQNTNFLSGIITKTANCHYEVNVNDYTTSVILIDNQKYSLTCENDNYYSIQLQINKNKDLFEKFIENFVKL